MSVLFYEFRLALTRLWRRRAQSLLTLATFAISISLALLGWSLFHTIYLKNPVYDAQGEFYRIGVTGKGANGRIWPVSLTAFEGWQKQQSVFTDFTPVALYQSLFVETNGGTERLLSANISTAALRMTHAQPLKGRLFTPDDDVLGCARVVLLSEKTWRNKYGADPDIIDRQIKVDSEPTTVVGIMPDSYRFPNEQEMWQPIGNHPFVKNRDWPGFDVLGRLKPGITATRAQADLQQVLDSMADQIPDIKKYEIKAVVQPLREYYLLPEMWQSSLILFSLALLFIIVGCANAANLVMIDFFGRTAETGSLLALGIPRGAAIRTLILQLLVLALIAAGIAYAVLLSAAPYVHGAMARIITPYWLLFTPEWHQPLMAGALALISVLFAVIVPVVYLLLVNPEKLIREGAGANRGTGRGLWRRLLMIGQIALLAVLGICAGLLYRSTRHVAPQNWGYDANLIFQSKTAMKAVDFPTPQVRLQKHEELVAELARAPGVVAAGMMTRPTGFSGETDERVATSADALQDGGGGLPIYFSAITPGIPTVFGARYIEGEPLSENQSPDDKNGYVIINASLAHKLWPGQSALGRALFIKWGGPQQPPMPFVIRGVVSDYQANGPKSPVNDFVFTSIRGGFPLAGFLFARGATTLPTLPTVRAAADRVDPRIVLYFAGSSEGTLAIELSSVHLTTRLALVYALAALFLCAVGVYSITVAQVVQRSREFGIRLALGIEPRALWQRFTAGHLIVAGIGVVAGIAATFGVVRVVQSLLFGVSAHDPLVFAGVAILILLVSALACIPSYFRLNRINPADCLRSL
ncbi:MAG: ABC transporter permease [Opitutaceae bacterium]|nr:ABC transporter permease [Opitutaceae bacterium]